METPHMLTTQTITVGAASVATTNAIDAQCRRIRLVSTTACHVAFGSAPVATTSDPLIPANFPEIIHVPRGVKVAAIQNAAGGTLFVTELDG